MEKLLTTKELAEAIGASESSLRRWTNSGAIRTSRTVGGHRRIPLSEAVRFIRESRATVVRPQVLGLAGAERVTRVAGEPSGGPSAAEESIYDGLVAGDAARVLADVLGLYLGGVGLAATFDGPLAGAMHRVGELWRHDSSGILAEHRASDICIQAVNQLRQLLAPPQPGGPAAVGGAAPGDPYLLPSMMAAAVLAEAGFRATNYGPQTPLDALGDAAEEQGAALVWLSLSVIDPAVRLGPGIEKLAKRLRRRDARLVLGGRHAADAAGAGKAAQNVQVLATMSELAAFLHGAKTRA
jgi:excisionase family DNA binding protein